MQPQPGGHFNSQQQLQPFSSTGSNSAHTSPLKRAPQAVSPLASPMESRRVFMAHQQAISEQQHGQPQHQSMGISAFQLGYAVPAPACRILVDPQTGQQYFVPTATTTAHPLPTPPAATAAYFQPALFYNQSAAFFQPHHQHQHSQSHSTTAVTNAVGNHPPPPGAYLYAASALHQPPAPNSAFFATSNVHHGLISAVPNSSSISPTSNTNAAFYSSGAAVPHRSQSPMGREPPYRVEVPPSTVDDGDMSIYRAEGVIGSDGDRDSQGGGGYYRRQEHPHNHQQQNFQRLDHTRLSTESRGSSTRGSGGGGGFYNGNRQQQHLLETSSNPEEEESAYGASYHRHPHSPPFTTPQHRHQHQSLLKPHLPPPLQIVHHQIHSPSSQQMTLSIGGGTGNGSSSESTSGIASGCRSRTRTFGDGGPIDEPRSPVPPQSPLREQRMMAFPAMREENQQRAGRSPPPPLPARRAIRMDIDLSRPLSPPEGASTTRPCGIGGGGFGAKQQPRGDNSSTTTASSVSVRATVLRTAPPTAFTISFNDESAQLGQVSISELSLQDAARQAPKGRRLMLNRRSVPPRGGQERQSGMGQNQQHDSGSECGGDPKRWLFRKMLMGREEKGGGKRQGSVEHQRGANNNNAVDDDDNEGDNEAEHEEEDLASEAGTYVVDKCAAAAAAMTISQISTQRQLDSDSKSSSSSTSSTTTATSSSRTPSPGPQKAQHQPMIRPSFPPANPSIQNAAGNVVKRSLMGDLRRLRENANSQSNPPPIMPPNSSVSMPKSTSSALPKLPPPIPSQRKIQQPPVTSSSSGNPPNRPCRISTGGQQPQQQQAFRPQSSRCRSEPRNDGGRFSMRPGQQNAPRPLPGLLKSGGSGGRGPIPMRQQSANAVASLGKLQQPVQKSPEMLNWLRRKEYDPRKSAAAITEQQKANSQLKAQSTLAPLAYAESTTSVENEEAFTANRSLSAVPSISGATITKSSAKDSPFARWRSATQGGGGGRGNDRSASVNRSHDDLSRLGGGESLDEESLLGAAPDSCTSDLKRTVDELTQKCNKSIHAIIHNSRLNQSTLSPSVEQLLERVAQTGAGGAVLQGTVGQGSSRHMAASTSNAAPMASAQLEGNNKVGSGGENISDQLDRLNSAFDAIQKYLEEQSSPGTSNGGGHGGAARTLSGGGTFRRQQSSTCNGNNNGSSAPDAEAKTTTTTDGKMGAIDGRKKSEQQ